MLKKFLSFSFFFLSFLHSEELEHKKFNVAISLGEVCQPAWYLRESHLRKQSFPFDWLITPFEGLLQFISNEGDFFLEKENLLFNVKSSIVPNEVDGSVLENLYGFYLYHDFDFEKDEKIKTFNETCVQNYDTIKNKYQRRKVRLELKKYMGKNEITKEE